MHSFDFINTSCEFNPFFWQTRHDFVKIIRSISKLVFLVNKLCLFTLFPYLCDERKDTFTRCEKYSSELDISRSFMRIFTVTTNKRKNLWQG